MDEMKLGVPFSRFIDHSPRDINADSKIWIKSCQKVTIPRANLKHASMTAC
jgi:hypothetical protein